MRIKTSAALKAVDRWRFSLYGRYENTRHSIKMLSLALHGSARGAILFFLAASLVSLNFAIPAFAFVVLFGVMKLRLHSYRFANFFLMRLSR
ncbi:MAG: hypothetical protein JRN68_01870 [Nitrososphaerota archaeon]|jgi:hypothetical protein|nr:hypothetical protein [Nitrososphaerota archaeon]